MGKKIHTILLLFVVAFLLISTMYVSYQLRQGPSLSGLTTIKKTKAASITYTKFIDLARPEKTISPSPTFGILAQADLTPTVSTKTADISITVTPSAFPIPTEINLVINSVKLSPTLGYENSSGTSSANLSPTSKKLSSLPETGWVQNSSIFFIVASAFILFSFLF